MAILYVNLFFLFRVLRKGKVIIKFICFIAVTAELTANAYSTFYCNSYTPKEQIGGYIEEISPIIEEVKNRNKDNFYRVEQSYKNTTNDSMLLNYNGLTHSSSANDLNLRDVLRNLGYKTSLVYELYGMGSTIPIDSILGIKYIIAINNNSIFNSYVYPQNMYFNKISTEWDYSVYENPYALPIAYMVNEKLAHIQRWDNESAFTYSNYILNAMVNESFDLYNPLEITDIKLNNVYTELINNETVYKKVDLTKNGTVEFTVKAVDNNPVFMFLKSQAYEDYMAGKTNGLIMKNNVRLNVNNHIKFEEFTSKGYNVQFIGNYLKDKEFKIVMTIMNNSTTIGEVQIYSCDMIKFKEVYDNLSFNQIENTEYKDGYIKGTINVESDKKLMFTSIPYDEGWKLKVDGEKKNYIKVLNGFIAVELDEGQHEIEFKYILPGLKYGIIISLASLCFLIYGNIKHRR